MNNTSIVKILGKDYPKESIKYSYTGKKMRYKKYLKYPILCFCIIYAIQLYVGQRFLSLAETSAINAIPDYNTEEILATLLRAIEGIEISLLIAFIILLIPRINCLFLKIDGTKKDIVLYKSIHKDEVALIANEINIKIKEDNFSSFPY